MYTFHSSLELSSSPLAEEYPRLVRFPVICARWSAFNEITLTLKHHERLERDVVLRQEGSQTVVSEERRRELFFCHDHEEGGRFRLWARKDERQLVEVLLD